MLKDSCHTTLYGIISGKMINSVTIVHPIEGRSITKRRVNEYGYVRAYMEGKCLHIIRLCRIDNG